MESYTAWKRRLEQFKQSTNCKVINFNSRAQGTIKSSSHAVLEERHTLSDSASTFTNLQGGVFRHALF
ncbi:hypothetical protein J6590_042319 [Homalodisca vitripennis]|nr:hypothetical protein J6590_042319 [Homalodisca vitripennis]